MEYCDGGTLEENYHRMESSEYHIWRLLWHLSSALIYLHGKSPPVVHRDIKPDNVLGKYYNNGSQTFIVWKLADFGIAKMLNR